MVHIEKNVHLNLKKINLNGSNFEFADAFFMLEQIQHGFGS